MGSNPCGMPVSLASKPGGDLLFHRLRDSTIGAVWFHGRVRDGIGWVTDAMATKLWGQRNRAPSKLFAQMDPDGLVRKSMRAPHMLSEPHQDQVRPVIDGGTLKRE